MSTAEDKVRELDKLRKEASKLENGMRSMRLGGGIEMKFKRFSWRAMVIGGGWARQDAELLPAGIENEFYLFLASKAADVAKKIKTLEKSLDALIDTKENDDE